MNFCTVTISDKGLTPKERLHSSIIPLQLVLKIFNNAHIIGYSKDFISLVFKGQTSRQNNKVGTYFNFNSIRVPSCVAIRPTFPIIALNALKELRFASSNLHLNLDPDISAPRYLHEVTHSIESPHVVTSLDNTILLIKA